VINRDLATTFQRFTAHNTEYTVAIVQNFELLVCIKPKYIPHFSPPGSKKRANGTHVKADYMQGIFVINEIPCLKKQRTEFFHKGYINLAIDLNEQFNQIKNKNK
jgi:hypothetical protein